MSNIPQIMGTLAGLEQQLNQQLAKAQVELLQSPHFTSAKCLSLEAEKESAKHASRILVALSSRGWNDQSQNPGWEIVTFGINSPEGRNYVNIVCFLLDVFRLGLLLG